MTSVLIGSKDALERCSTDDPNDWKTFDQKAAKAMRYGPDVHVSVIKS